MFLDKNVFESGQERCVEETFSQAGHLFLFFTHNADTVFVCFLQWEIIPCLKIQMQTTQSVPTMRCIIQTHLPNTNGGRVDCRTEQIAGTFFHHNITLTCIGGNLLLSFALSANHLCLMSWIQSRKEGGVGVNYSCLKSWLQHFCNFPVANSVCIYIII